MLKSIFKKVFFVFFLTILFCSLPVSGSNRKIVKNLYKGKQIECYENEIIIKLKSGVNLNSVLDNQNKLSLIKSISKGKIAKIKVHSGLNYDFILDSLKNNPLIDYAEPNFVVKALSTYPNDTYFQSGRQWSLCNTGQSPIYGTAGADIDMTEAWDIKTSANSILVAV